MALLDILAQRFLIGPRDPIAPRHLPGYVPFSKGLPAWWDASRKEPVSGEVLGVHEFSPGDPSGAFIITRDGFGFPQNGVVEWIPFADFASHKFPPKELAAGEVPVFTLITRSGREVRFLFRTVRETFEFMAFVRAILTSVAAGQEPGRER